MLIRDRSMMEKAMHYTYDDLAAKRKELSWKVSERNTELLEFAGQLVREYEASLMFKGDYSGRIAFIGDFVEGRAQPAVLSSMQMDDDYHLRFNIITDLSVNELPKDFILVGVEIYRESGKLRVVVGDEDHRQVFQIIRGEPEGCFSEVCAGIKECVARIIENNMPK